MRRIIERKVTVVTTTTWTISWQDDSPHPSPEAVSNMDVLPAAHEASPIIEIKEADAASAKKSNQSQSNELHSYPSKLKKEIEP